MLPSCKDADIEIPGSSQPNTKGTTFRCAVLLIGINSVIPWINPKIR